MPKVIFQNDREIDAPVDDRTLLQLSLEAGIPHVHACGGNARCSTCRVMVHDGLEHLNPRNPAEQKLALRKGLEENIRLACQTRTSGPCRVRRLVLDDVDADGAIAADALRGSGRECKIAILFTDIKDFTPMSTGQLPYDIVHLLNRYFRVIGEVVLQHDGFVDKYIGDGMMALFGLDDPDPTFACLDAVSAALAMQEKHVSLNAYFQKHFNLKLETRVGIHYGEVVVGQMGHPLKQQFTAIGDSVNIASRVESSCKGAGASVLISQSVYNLVGSRIVKGVEVSTKLKGKEGDFHLYEVKRLVNGAASVWPIAKRVRRRLREVISRRIGPMFLRLVYHDAVTFDPVTNTGGMNGSIRFPEELNQPENAGLDKAIAVLAPVKQEFANVSWADLISLAGAVAVLQSGGPDIGIPLGRKDSDAPDPAGRLPSPDEPWDPLRERLIAMGFTMSEMVALCGAHTVGRVNDVPFTDDPFHFTNAYFRLLACGDAAVKRMLKSDRAMALDPECLVHVEAYAMDEALFFREFAAGYRKLTLLGTGL
ncbi:MAG TPA: peroxidase family protein [Tepidisphaeraceae bacterium]|nr:peroxidase family protein [Tepidisphaeraceae bacterium]